MMMMGLMMMMIIIRILLLLTVIVLMVMMINNAFVPLTSLIDIDECQAKSCPDNSICKNTPGNFTCTCKEGYAGKTCSGKNLQIHFQTLDIKFTIDGDC